MARPRTKPAIELPPCAERLRSVLVWSKLTNKEFAQRVGMSPGGLSGIFSKGIKVRSVLAKAVELEFGISQHWLLGNKNPEPSKDADGTTKT